MLLRHESGEIPKPAPKLIGYKGDFDTHFVQIDEFYEKGDIIDCESISLQDKMAYFENWDKIK